MRKWILLPAGFVIVMLAIAATGAKGDFTADVMNAGNSLTSATQFLSLTDEEGAPMCSSLPAAGDSVIPSTSDFTCNGTALPESTVSTKNINILTSGTSLAGSTTIQGLSCLPVSGANLANPDNPVLPRYNAGLGYVAGPKGGTALAVTRQRSDATSVYMVKTVLSFTKSIWVRTSLSSPNVGIMGGSSSPDFNGATFDSYFDTNANGGTVGFHFRPANADLYEVTSTTSVTDNEWHFAAVTLNDDAPRKLKLYIDGELEGATNIPMRVIAFSKYVHLGSLGFGQPVEGAVSNAAMWTTPLSGSNIKSLFDAEDQESYSDLVMNLGASNYWPLTDNGLTTFDGEIEYLDGASPCDYSIFRVWRPDHYCIFPDQENNCTDSASLADFTRDPVSLPSMELDENYELTFTAAPVTEPFVAGLSVVMPIRLSQSGFDQSFTIPNNVIQLNE